MRVRICVIFNPVAKGDKARRFRAQLDDIGRHAALKLTQSAGDATRLAAEAVAEGFEVIVAAGGDGTVNEVLNGMGRAQDGFARAALGVLPLGTVNVFARELGLPRRLDQAWAVLQRGKQATIDVGVVEGGGEREGETFNIQHSTSNLESSFAEATEDRLETRNTEHASRHSDPPTPNLVLRQGYEGPASKEGSQGGLRYFAQLAGAGLDARAIELVNWRLKKQVGPLAYVWAGLKALVERKPVITVRSAAGELRGELVLIGNGRLYGGDYATVPAAQLDDGRLDVCVLPRVNFLVLLRCAWPLLWSKRLPDSLVRRVQTERFTLSAAEPVAYELDGELAGRLPVTFSVQRRALRVVVP